MKRAFLISNLIFLFSFMGLALAGKKRQVAATEPFEAAVVRFEQNATDDDVEVVFEVQGGSDGLVKLQVTAPDGRTAIDFTAPDASTMGIRKFHFESPEPGDTERLAAAYPEGVYVFTGTTSSGVQLKSKATLSHKLPATAPLLQPVPESEDAPSESLVLTWAPVKGLVAYIIELEQEDMQINLAARLQGSANSLTVPDDLVFPNMEYKVGIGTVSDIGNISFVEFTFTTAGEESSD